MQSFLLVRHPPALARLQEEIRPIVAEEGTLNRAHIQKLNYLRCILNESESSLLPVEKEIDRVCKMQRIGFIRSYRSTFGLLPETPSYLKAEAPTASRR